MVTCPHRHTGYTYSVFESNTCLIDFFSQKARSYNTTASPVLPELLRPGNRPAIWVATTMRIWDQLSRVAEKVEISTLRCFPMVTWSLLINLYSLLNIRIFSIGHSPTYPAKIYSVIFCASLFDSFEWVKTAAVRKGWTLPFPMGHLSSPWTVKSDGHWFPLPAAFPWPVITRLY